MMMKSPPPTAMTNTTQQPVFPWRNTRRLLLAIYLNLAQTGTSVCRQVHAGKENDNSPKSEHSILCKNEQI